MTELDRPSERGAVLVFTALALTALAGFLVFVIDQGVLMVARNQAQNAADAGALAGATALVFDEVVAPPVVGGPAEQSALAAAAANPVWDGPAVAEVSLVGGVGGPGCSGPTGSCIRVSVYRNGEFGSTPLPTMFGPVLGIASQRVRAMATAEATPSNATQCERPVALPYTAMTVVGRFGTEITLAPPAMPNDFGEGKYRLVDVWGGPLPDARTAMRRCATIVYGIGDSLPLAAFPAADPADFVAGLQDLIALDPAMDTWDDLNDSCVRTRTCQKYDAVGENLVADPGATVSPRVITLPLFDSGLLLPFSVSATVANHVGLFLTDAWVDAGEVKIRGTIVTTLGLIRANTAVPSFDSAFLRTIRLVR